MTTGISGDPKFLTITLPDVKNYNDGNKNKKYEILTGKLIDKKIQIDNQSNFDECEKNIKTARKIMEFVNEHKIQSYNHSRGVPVSISDYEKTGDSLVKIRKKDFLPSKIALIEKLKAGNCKELALISLNYKDKYISPDNLPIYVYRLNKGDHVVTLVGESDGWNRNNPSTNFNGMIVDCWTGAIYPAIDYKKYTYSYLEPITVTNKSNQLFVFPSVQKLNEEDYLEPLFPYSNIYINNIPKIIINNQESIDYRTIVEGTRFLYKMNLGDLVGPLSRSKKIIEIYKKLLEYENSNISAEDLRKIALTYRG